MGRVSSPDSCPIALALRRYFPEAQDENGQWNISVDNFIRINDRCRHKLGPDGRVFIYRFDNGKDVEPFEFEMERS